MSTVLLVDFGSTNTKVIVIDLDKEEVLGVAQSVSTVDTDITLGLADALDKLRLGGLDFKNLKIERKLACSSAAGGLRLVAVGLVPSLTVEAARLAVLGAGGRVVASYAYELCDQDVEKLKQQSCDILLLAGGIDGGNKKVIIHNARMIAGAGLGVPIIVAGNRSAAEEVRNIFSAAGEYVEVVENVLPDLESINVEPTQSLVREIFMQRIVRAKGLNKAEKYIDEIIMPTPMATLKAAKLLADGADGEKGLGELMVVEVGGATVNVHSVCAGHPTRSDVVMKGLPQPRVKRTVEGDLGIRYNAPTILDIVGEDRISQSVSELQPGREVTDLRIVTDNLSKNIGFLPRNEDDFLIDTVLARSAVDVAVERHVGFLREIYTAMGRAYVQYGQDLTAVPTVIATGGIFAYGRAQDKILEAVIFSERNPFSLKPRAPQFYLDRRYILFAIGLLSDIAPAKALRIAKKYLGPLTGPAKL